MKNFKVCKFFSRILSDSVGITIFVIFFFIDPLKQLCDFLFISLYRLLFLEKSIDELFLEFNPSEIKFKTLSDQTRKSDVVYRLLQIGEEVRHNNSLAKILSSIISVSDATMIEQEITNLYGSSPGSSSLCYNLDEFSKNTLWESYNGRKRIGFTTAEDWQNNTSSFTRELARDFKLHYYKWNNRCFLSNGEAAHRTAAIFRQAKS